MAESQKTISEDAKRELQEAFLNGGAAKLQDLIQRKTNEWKNIPLNIAIIGVSGVGKSSFINAILGITADDEGGAHVDVVEAAIDIKPYPHPKNNSMVLWDLPGVGTTRFPRSNYLKQVDYKKYDFFLILSYGRIREDDIWLGKEIRGLKKKFYFVRTHIDSEVENDKKSHPKTHSKANVIEKIAKDCRKQLDDNALSKASVFLIDNYTPLDFDFDRLWRALINDAPGHKREAMIFSLSVLTDGIIEEKVEALEDRIYMISLLSAVVGAIPIPGLNAAVDVPILLTAVKFYKKQLGLDAKTLAKYRISLGLKSDGLAICAKSLLLVISSIAVSAPMKSSLPIVVPLLGSIVSAGISYGVTKESLHSILSVLKDDALKINEALIKKNVQ